ncbi:unnamed protein product [Tilletia caries]|nr:unnamed protein product [Tilletia caries]
MPGPRSFRSHGGGGGGGGAPPSPTLSATTRASLDFPSRPSVLVTRSDLRASLSAFEGLLSAAKGYTNVMLTMAQASAELAGALETCARVKGAHESGAGLHASSALHFLMSNYQQVLADSLWKDFSIPLLSHFDTYRSGVAERQVGHEQAVAERSKLLKETEARNMRTGRRKERDLGSFRRALAELQAQVDGIDEIKAQYYHEVIENEEEVWEYILSKVSLMVRSQLEVAERVASKGSSDPILEPMLASIPDPFDSYGPPKQDDQIFSILPPTSLLSSSTVMPSPGIGSGNSNNHHHHHKQQQQMTPSGSSSTVAAGDSSNPAVLGLRSPAIGNGSFQPSGYNSPASTSRSGGGGTGGNSGAFPENGTATVGSLLGLHSTLASASSSSSSSSSGGNPGPGAGRLFGDDTLDEDDVLLGGGGVGGGGSSAPPQRDGGRLKKALSIINEDVHIVPLDQKQQRQLKQSTTTAAAAAAAGAGTASQRRIQDEKDAEGEADEVADVITESTPTRTAKKKKSLSAAEKAAAVPAVVPASAEDEDVEDGSRSQTKTKKGKDPSRRGGSRGSAGVVDDDEEAVVVVEEEEEERVPGSANASQGVEAEAEPEVEAEEEEEDENDVSVVTPDGSPPRRRKNAAATTTSLPISAPYGPKLVTSSP